MGKSYFPNSDAKLSIWTSNYKEKISSVASQLGLTPEQVSKQQGNCEKVAVSINTVASRRTDLGSAIKERNTIITNEGGSLRFDINNIKTLSGYTEAIGKTLGIVSNPASVDFATFKPSMSIEMFGGSIRIKFRKKETDGINIYRRKKNSSEWLFLARATKSPFDQSFTLEVPGQPELWEYRAYGVVEDNEVGVASDIVQVIYIA